MNSYPRLVSWSYNSGLSRFSKSTSKERLQKIYITDPDGESLLKDGQIACLNRGGLSMDPYFKIVNEVGYTPRARKHRELEKGMTESYPELRNKLKGFNAKLKDYNEYVYLDLSYIDNYVNSIVEDNPNFETKHFLKKGAFNKEFILNLISYKPQAAMGGTITSFIKKEMPKFMSELKIKFPSLYSEVLAESEWLQDIHNELTLVGKKAVLASLSPGLVEVEEDILNDVEYLWDGNILTAEKTTMSGELIEKTITPSKDMIVKISDDSVVSEFIELVD